MFQVIRVVGDALIGGRDAPHRLPERRRRGKSFGGCARRAGDIVARQLGRFGQSQQEQRQRDNRRNSQRPERKARQTGGGKDDQQHQPGQHRAPAEIVVVAERADQQPRGKQAGGERQRESNGERAAVARIFAVAQQEIERDEPGRIEGRKLDRQIDQPEHRYIEPDAESIGDRVAENFCRFKPDRRAVAAQGRHLYLVVEHRRDQQQRQQGGQAKRGDDAKARLRLGPRQHHERYRHCGKRQSDAADPGRTLKAGGHGQREQQHFQHTRLPDEFDQQVGRQQRGHGRRGVLRRP